jgi:hypothetical protein
MRRMRGCPAASTMGSAVLSAQAGPEGWWYMQEKDWGCRRRGGGDSMMKEMKKMTKKERMKRRTEV